MAELRGALASIDAATARALAYLTQRRWRGAAALVLLALACYLPGVLALPPVDRSEILYAENAQEMLEQNEPFDPRFIGESQAHRPIGTYWLQMASAWLAPESERGDITTYRIPSLIGVVLAVLLVFLMLAPLMGEARALVAAALFAVTPIVALEANLAVTEGAVLGSAVLAQLALLRIYTAPEGGSTRLMALVFWTAQGFSILLNALAVPILSLVTVMGLYVLDRRLGWLRRLHALTGVPLMLVIGAPWLLVRAGLDGGIPFDGMSLNELLAALGGSQHMKWKAAPLTFTLALAFGFLPGAVFWIPALKTIWQGRQQALPRFLFSWLASYFLYLELVSSKPALYSVHVLFPAAAAAVVLAMTRNAPDGRRWEWPAGTLVPPVVLVALGVPALYGGILWLLDEWPDPGLVFGAVAVTLLLSLATAAGRAKLPLAWVALSVASFAVFLAFTFGFYLPHLQKPWPAVRIAEAIGPLAACAPGPVGIVGFREPSAIFVLGDDTRKGNVEDVAAWVADGDRRIALVDDLWHGDLLKALAERGAKLPARTGCVEAFNVMRGCPLVFSIYVTGAPKLDPGCKVPERFSCKGPLPQTPADTQSRCR